MIGIAEKFTPDELKELEELTKLYGVLKKKRDPGITAKLKSSKEKYFKFFCNGRYLVYFDGSKAPTINSKPKNIIFIDEIVSVEENYMGKPTHFNIRLRGDKNLHLKAPSPDEAKKWCTTLKRVSQLFAGKFFVDTEPLRKWKDKVELRVLNMIMEDVEREHFALILEDFDFKHPLEAKGLASFYNSFKENTRRTRFMMSMATHSSTKHADQLQQDEELVKGITKTATNMFKLGVNFVIPFDILWNKVYMVMATSKSYVGLVLIIPARRCDSHGHDETFTTKPASDLDGTRNLVHLQVRWATGQIGIHREDSRQVFSEIILETRFLSNCLNLMEFRLSRGTVFVSR